MIFTGLSNNWALLQRVNAIEKYLNENSIVPYAKSSVAGEGTDTFVFNKSQLSVANGADLMVGDLIICPDVTLWQVISIADSGEVTARFLVNFKGEQGEAGADGETPFAYLGGIIDTNTEPSAGKTVVLSNTDFSKTPKNGDRFVGFLRYNGVIYSATLAYLRPYIEGDNQTMFNYQDTQKITGEPGESEKLYRHRIKISATASLWPEIYTEIINTSETPFDINSLTSLIEGKQQVANGIATGTEPLFQNSVLYIYSKNSALYAKTAYLNDVAFERQNITITDTVEEI